MLSWSCRRFRCADWRDFVYVRDLQAQHVLDFQHALESLLHFCDRRLFLGLLPAAVGRRSLFAEQFIRPEVRQRFDLRLTNLRCYYCSHSGNHLWFTRSAVYCNIQLHGNHSQKVHQDKTFKSIGSLLFLSCNIFDFLLVVSSECITPKTLLACAQ